MTIFTAKFSNGTEYVANTKREFVAAWRVEWVKEDGSIDNAGGFSSSFVNAEKAMNAWVARMSSTAIFCEVTEAR